MTNRKNRRNKESYSTYIVALCKFQIQGPVRSLILIDNKIIEKVNFLNYFGNLISYEKEVDIGNKRNNYLKITGIINNVFSTQNSKVNKNKIIQ
jgi:hypothetical protein